MSASGILQEQIAIKHNLVGFPFTATDIADADGTLFAVQATTPTHTMPAAGSIVGISGNMNGTLNTGTLQFQATINGSLCPVFPQSTALFDHSTTYAYGMHEARKDNYVFTAGQYIGLTLQSSDTVEPVTRDASVMLWVLLENVEL